MTHAGYFEGTGGFSLAAEWLGMETVYTCELDEFRHNWLKYRFKNAHHEKDIRETNGFKADLFTAGFPCQDVSSANANPTGGKGLDGEQSGLWHEMFRIVAAHRPDYLLVENSPRLVHRGLHTILRQLAAIGYDAEWFCTGKRELGFPDFRKRLFLVSYPVQKRLDNLTVFNRHAYAASRNCYAKEKSIFHEISRMDGYESWRKTVAHLCKSDSGLPEGVVKNEIMAYGDAVCPHVAYVVMHMILQYENILKNIRN
jgi:DNA (cytosine-5)-methyltransferase 1